jgi:hypothetical protein
MRGSDAGYAAVVVISRFEFRGARTPAVPDEPGEITTWDNDPARTGLHGGGRARCLVLVAYPVGGSRDLWRCAIRNQPAPRRRGAEPPDETAGRLLAAGSRYADPCLPFCYGLVFLAVDVETTNLQTSPTSFLQSFFGVAANVAGVVGGVVVIVFLAMYFAAEADAYSSALIRLVPPARRGRASEILH